MTSDVMSSMLIFFFFNDTATTEIYTLSLHDALPISLRFIGSNSMQPAETAGLTVVLRTRGVGAAPSRDRKSTRLNSSHSQISYAVFCLKKNRPADAEVRYDRHSSVRTVTDPRPAIPA